MWRTLLGWFVVAHGLLTILIWSPNPRTADASAPMDTPTAPRRSWAYTIWFMSAWTPATLGEREQTMALFDAPASGGAGKTVGVLALVVVAGFLAAAFGIWQHTAWWPAALVATIAAAVPIGLLWNPSGMSAPWRPWPTSGSSRQP